MVNNARLTHKDRLLSEIIGLSVKERTMQLMFDIQILFMLSAAAIGLYSLLHKSYRLFLMVSYGDSTHCFDYRFPHVL